MSGIAGIYNLDGRPVDEGILRRVTDAMAHRGPDGAGYWIRGSTGFGHRLLWATPEAVGEKQPLQNERGELCLTMDGRVDNRGELGAALEARGFHLRDDTDAELVLKAYECWGEECPGRILGDFALAVWDGRKRQLFSARDVFGVKPFYYWSGGGRVVFASAMQALFEEPAIPKRANLPLVGLYLMGWYNERHETLYEGVLRLPAAHAMVFRESGARMSQYWDADPDHEARCASDGEYAERFLALFKEAVRARLRSHGPVAVAVSGGLDSSSILCTAAAIRPEGSPELHSCSMLYPGLSCDETEYIREVVETSGATPHYSNYAEQDAASFRFSRAYECPDLFWDPNGFNFDPVLAGMRGAGVKVLLDGVGGDELLDPSYGCLADLFRQGEFSRLASELRLASAEWGVPLPRLFLNHCVKRLVPPRPKAVLRRIKWSVAPPARLRLVKRDFPARDGLLERACSVPRIPGFRRHCQQDIYTALVWNWNALIAREMSELAHSRFSFDLRHPFFDRRVAEFILGLPGSQLCGNGRSKLILREAMRGILPEKVRTRRGKAEFSEPIDRELRGRQADDAERLFRTSTLASAGVLDAERLLGVWGEYRKGSPEYLTGTVSLALQLELWHRILLGAKI